MYYEKFNAQILDGSLTNCPHHLEGHYHGFYMTIQNINSQLYIRINAQNETDINNVRLAQFLENQKMTTKEITAVTTYSYSFVLQIKPTRLIKNIPGRINTVLSPVFQW